MKKEVHSVHEAQTGMINKMLAGFRSSVAKHLRIKQAVLGSITMVTKYFKFCCLKNPVKERKYI